MLLRYFPCDGPHEAGQFPCHGCHEGHRIAMNDEILERPCDNRKKLTPADDLSGDIPLTPFKDGDDFPCFCFKPIEKFCPECRAEAWNAIRKGAL